jgi:hypothetical protein
MHIYETGRDDEARAIDDFSVIGISNAAACALNPSIGDEYVTGFIHVARRVENSATAEKNRATSD